MVDVSICDGARPEAIKPGKALADPLYALTQEENVKTMRYGQDDGPPDTPFYPLLVGLSDARSSPSCWPPA